MSARVPRITSRQHPLVMRFRRLAERREDGSILVDGPHLVDEALAAGLPFEAALTDERHAALGQRARAAGGAVYDASARVLEAASPVRSPTGIVAIVTWRPRALADAIHPSRLTIGLVGVQDPGNVGSVIRSADALGGGGVLLLDGSADPGSWKALRGAMGSTFRIPVARGHAAHALDLARDRRIPVLATAAGRGTAIGDADLSPPALVLLGSEGGGLAEGLLARVDRTLSIPMDANVESLNVAVTAALVLWEAGRRAAVRS
jgi:TrmH family RNA methyltransferase